MNRRFNLLSAAVAALVAGSIAAFAANTVFFTNAGDIVFPISPPTSAGAVPGRIDNMTIGATTPAPASFTTLTTTGTTAAAGLACPSHVLPGVPTAAQFVDAVFFVATRAYLVVSASQVHAVAAGGTSTAQVTKDTSTNAPGAGTDLLTAAFNLNATANTVQSGALTATSATKTLAAGDRLSIDFANAVQSSSGVAVTVCLAPL